MNAHSPLHTGLIACTLAWLAFAATASAQTIDLGAGAPGAGENVVIEADNGIEWHQTDQVFLARGNAQATRGTVTVHADTLRAHYREKPDGGTDVWRLDADGNVRIVTPGEKATGDLAVYDVEGRVLILSGQSGTRFEAGTDVITAKKQMEYWELKNVAVARGDAHALQNDKNLWAEVLVAHFARNEKTGKSELYRVEAFDNVRIETAQDNVKADRGVYNARSGLATVTGKVIIQRGKNVLNGCKAEVDLNSGISKLFGCDANGRGRVSGTLQPGKLKRNLEQ